MKYKTFILVGIVALITGILISSKPFISISDNKTPDNFSTYTKVLKAVNTLDHNKIYLAFKGTNSKPGEIAKNYNISNKDVSHVGILYFEDEWKVIHVTNTQKDNNNLYIETVGEFYDTINKPTYASVFEVSALTKKEIIDSIHTLSDKKIYFDLNFDTGNDRYYCSEFVVSLINKRNNLDLYLAKKEISNIQHKYFLRKDTLEYYPVDVFYNNGNFIKKYETKF